MDQCPAPSPPFAAMSRAVGAHVATVEGGCVAGPSGLGQRGEHRLPEAAPRPAIEAVVDRGARAVGGWAIAPTAARSQDVQDTGDDLPIVLPLGSGLVLGHERVNHRPLLIREPEQVRHRHLPGCQTAAWNHKTTNLATAWFGSHPRDCPLQELHPYRFQRLLGPFFIVVSGIGPTGAG